MQFPGPAWHLPYSWLSVSGTKARVPPEVAARVRRIKEEEASAPRMPCERWSEAFGGIVAQPPIFQRLCHIGRQRSAQHQGLACHGMGEGQPEGVQRLARHAASLLAAVD